MMKPVTGAPTWQWSYDQLVGPNAWNLPPLGCAFNGHWRLETACIVAVENDITLWVVPSSWPVCRTNLLAWPVGISVFSCATINIDNDQSYERVVRTATLTMIVSIRSEVTCQLLQRMRWRCRGCEAHFPVCGVVGTPMSSA